MIVYMLEFVEGEYSDYTEKLLGIYSSAEKRNEALAFYIANHSEDLVVGGNREGEYRAYEVELDKNLLRASSWS